MLFKVIGVIGMLIIILGVLAGKGKDIQRNYLFLAGSTLLFAYSLYLRDPIFTPLQVVFGGASIFEIWKLKRE